MGETNLEQVLDINKETTGLQLPDNFENTFKDQSNRQKIVDAAKDNFKDIQDTDKKAITDKTTTEIQSWGKMPNKGDKDYTAKIAVLYLHTALNDPSKKDPSPEDVKATYDALTKITTDKNTPANVIDMINKNTKQYAEDDAKMENLGKSRSGKKITIGEYKGTISGVVNGDLVMDISSESSVAFPVESIDKDKIVLSGDKIVYNRGDHVDVQNILPTPLDEKTDAEIKSPKQIEKPEEIISYGKEGNTWGHYETGSVQLPAIANIKGGAALGKEGLSLPTQEFKADQILNTFMENKDLKNDSMFFPDKSGEPTDTFNFVTKNYPSLSKNSDIKKQIDAQIKDYVENQNSSREYPKIALEKNLTGVSLQVDTSGQSYFDIPVSNLKKKSSEGIKSLHLYSQGVMGNNIMINEGVADIPSVAEKEEKKEPQQEKISTPSVSDIDITDRTNPGLGGDSGTDSSTAIPVPKTEKIIPDKITNTIPEFIMPDKAPTMLDAKPLAGTENKLNTPTITEIPSAVKTEIGSTSVDTKETGTQIYKNIDDIRSSMNYVSKTSDLFAKQEYTEKLISKIKNENNTENKNMLEKELVRSFIEGVISKNLIEKGGKTTGVRNGKTNFEVIATNDKVYVSIRDVGKTKPIEPSGTFTKDELLKVL